MNYCQRFSAYLVRLKPEDATLLITRTRCKMWDCEFCAKRNKSDWRQRIADAVGKKPLWKWYFWTLTAHEDDRTPQGSLKNISQAWEQLINVVRKRVKRDLNEFCYVRVLEPHKDGALHIHALVGFRNGYLYDDLETYLNDDSYSEPLSPCWIPDEVEISYLNRSYGAGYICDVRKLPSEDLRLVTAYVTKYMTKLERPLPKNVRRIQCSQGWVRPEKNNAVPSGWTLRHKITEVEAMHHWRNNVRMYDVQNKHEVTTDDFQQTGYYG